MDGLYTQGITTGDVNLVTWPLSLMVRNVTVAVMAVLTLIVQQTPLQILQMGI